MKLIIISIMAFTILFANNIYYKHIVMIGDSITEGALWSELTNRNDIINRGISGDTTNGVLDRLNSLNSDLQQAFIMIGINDLLRGQNAEYVFDNYKRIIVKLKSISIKPVIQSTLYVRSNTKTINQIVKQLNNLLKNYAKKNKIQFIDLNNKLAPKGVLLEKYSLDGLHLNGKGYVEWSKILKSYIKN